VRRVATIEKKQVFSASSRRYATRERSVDLIPALKGRANLMATLRVALLYPGSDPQKEIEAGSRSPLHNPASTHGRLNDNRTYNYFSRTSDE
jgi:hypothetical protein